MHPGGYFSRRFKDARAAFLAACSGQAVSTYAHPLGDGLACDVVRVGPATAKKLLILISGVHGVELYPGSACQTGWLRSGPELPEDTACLLIHAINPWGAKHFRRNTEDNIDLARNFCDFTSALPENSKYPALHAAIAEGGDIVGRKMAEMGEQTFVNGLMQGQYSHADGFGYGGQAPCWSNKTLRSILKDHAGAASNVAVIEYHSGLGPYGYGMAVTFDQGDMLARTKDWFGPWTLAPHEGEGDGPGHAVIGHTSNAYRDAFRSSKVSAVVLEYGTVPPQVSLPIMLEDHRLTVSQSDGLQDVREKNLAVHNPPDPDWQQAVWDRSQLAIAQALRGLSETR